MFNDSPNNISFADPSANASRKTDTFAQKSAHDCTRRANLSKSVKEQPDRLLNLLIGVKYYSAGGVVNQTDE
jgi:hypothetical protein